MPPAMTQIRDDVSYRIRVIAGASAGGIAAGFGRVRP